MNSNLTNIEDIGKAVTLLGLVSLIGAAVSYIQIMNLALTLKDTGVVTDMTPYLLLTLVQLALVVVYAIVIMLAYGVMKRVRNQ